MSHACSAVIVHCIDFRLGPAIHDFLHERGLMGDCDRVAIAGAAQAFAGEDVEFVLRQIAISDRLHGIRRVIVMNHTDCGAYGGRAAFAGCDDERAAHVDAMSIAERVVRERFPHLEVTRVLAHIEEDGSVRMEEVAHAHAYA